MSISGALSNALSGLTASSRAADVSASNIANVLTEGYGVRSLVLTPRSIGDEGGVSIVGVSRHVNSVLLSDRRSSEALLNKNNALQDFFSRLQAEIGLPTETGSLSDRLVQLEASLIEATISPESDSLLSTVVDNLNSIALKLNDASDYIQNERARADKQIDQEVQSINEYLVQISELNTSIKKHSVLDHDVSSLLDSRQVLIDKLNSLIPVTELSRDNNEVALMTSGGILLVDGRPAEFGFTNSSFISPDMSIEGGSLSKLSVNGIEIDTSLQSSDIAGGRLDALFQIRDRSSVEIQEKLDGVSLEIIERFEDTAVDPTRLASDPGLFTDSGSVLDPLNVIGLAQRISLNPLVDPNSGGGAWRLRDGLGAASPVPGGEGDTTIIQNIMTTLSNLQTPSSSAFSSSSSSIYTLVSDTVSSVGHNLENANNDATYAKVQYDFLKEMELSEGVDSDAEMQKLLIIEQAYAANARVVQTVDEMLDWLMRI